MDTGQMSMMPASAGVTTLAATQLASPATGLSAAGEQAGGNFVGVLQGMAAEKTSPGAGSASAGKGATSSPATEKNAGADAAKAVQDGMTGLMAGLLNALDMSDKPLTGGAEPAADVPTTGASDTKSQNVALNADGIQSALLLQMNGGRMLQAGGAVIPQKVVEVSTTAGGTQAALPIRMSGSGIVQVDGTAAQQKAAALVPEVAVATDEAAIAVPAALTAGVDGGQKSAGDAELLKTIQAALAQESPLQGLSAPSGLSRDVLPAEPAAAQPVMAAAEQNTLMTKVGNLSTERGTATSGQVGSGGEATLSRVGSATPGKTSASAEVKTATPAPVNTEQQQAVTLPRSAALEAALAGGLTQKDGGTAEQAQATPPTPAAQNAQATGTLLATAGKASPADTRSEKSVVSDPAPVSPGVQQPDQAAATADARTSRTGEGTRSAHAGVVSEAGKKGAELGGETAQTRVERGAVAKAVEGASADVAPSTGDAPTGGEFSSGNEKGAADQFTNGQFHTTAVHQQGKIEGASVASSVAAPVQNSGQRSELSEQIMQQVKDRLVNHEVKTGSDQIVLKLSPENLGELRVNMSMDGQRLKVEIVAENRMVRDALLQNTDSLKESLARQNISMESFDVTTGDRGAGNPGQGQQQQNLWREFTQQQKQQNAWLTSGGYRLPDTTATAASSQLAYQTPSQHTMVDLHF